MQNNFSMKDVSNNQNALIKRKIINAVILPFQNKIIMIISKIKIIFVVWLNIKILLNAIVAMIKEENYCIINR